MKLVTSSLSLLLLISTAQAQSPQQEFTDPVALLKAVAKTYAAGADTFHFESIEETTRSDELHHEWSKVYRTAIKGPANLYRIETRSPWGSYVQDSDGTNEWIYLAEAKVYVKRPLPQNWPGFPRSFGAGSAELKQAWPFRFPPFCWIMVEDERGLTAPLPQENSGLAAGVKSPVSRRVRWVGSQPFTQQAACQPRWLATIGE